jgi:hypothetical protein
LEATVAPEIPLTAREQERRELQSLLDAGVFAKAPNLQSFLEYVAGKHFSGEADDVKEYHIAVEALHRSPDFNPHFDTIVRVTAHSLRKRLELYYGAEGSGHSVHIQLPTGKYQLRFVHREKPAEVELAVLEAPSSEFSAPPALSQAPEKSAAATFLIPVMVGMALFVAVGSYLVRHSLSERSTRAIPAAQSAMPAPPAGTRSVRFLAGSNRSAFTDPSGQAWSADRFCTGGADIAITGEPIQGTEESALFIGGRKGAFHCRIPVEAGDYELRLLFADTENTQENVRIISYTVNDGDPQVLDVVDQAGGQNVATEKIITGVSPLKDGAIHLDFAGDGSFVNAVEVLPAPSTRMLPVRMVAAPVAFHDSAGNIWSPDRFFSGGTRVFHPDVLSGKADAGLYQWERYGHFHYSIPVVAGRDYDVVLYFTEAWFGAPNGGPGGPGSRVFDVYGDGTTLLKDYDIARQETNGVSKVTFHHVKPTAQGLIDIYFAPIKNYALVNAIEIDDVS